LGKGVGKKIRGPNQEFFPIATQFFLDRATLSVFTFDEQSPQALMDSASL
jgi:hypothetical protein